MINNRKEVVNNHAKIEFTQIAEAKDFRETLSIKEQSQSTNNLDDVIEKKFPLEL